MTSGQTTGGGRRSRAGRRTSSTDENVENPYGFQRLLAWRKAMDFVECAHRETRSWPSHELYGLTNQLRRCSVSIPANIAEGQGRGSDGDFARFLSIAHGSVREAETSVIISGRLGYTSKDTESEMLSLLAETGRLVQGLIRMIHVRRDGDAARSMNRF